LGGDVHRAGHVGRSIGRAVSAPDDLYGETTRSAPARRSLLSDSSSAARATIAISGRSSRAVRAGRGDLPAHLAEVADDVVVAEPDHATGASRGQRWPSTSVATNSVVVTSA